MRKSLGGPAACSVNPVGQTAMPRPCSRDVSKAAADRGLTPRARSSMPRRFVTDFVAITGRLGSARHTGEPMRAPDHGPGGMATNDGLRCVCATSSTPGLTPCVWSVRRFASAIPYTCAECDEQCSDRGQPGNSSSLTEWDTVLFSSRLGRTSARAGRLTSACSRQALLEPGSLHRHRAGWLGRAETIGLVHERRPLRTNPRMQPTGLHRTRVRPGAPRRWRTS